MARALALVADLLFGSRLQGALASAGHETELVGSEASLRERLGATDEAADVLIVDLSDGALEGARIVQELLAAGALTGVRTLGFYAHVEADTRERAERAGFDLVVPRSRIAREGPALVARLVGPAAPRDR